ncbi:serine/threonine-protein kinase [Acanthopleuribacter pedis]|uniref:Serine/threonine protein kinase n=1 Tax=Acanthopleuribacter pedis TaxID=442870 RepID=A0A8J7U4N4_9BACT|nr:serine/threonine-protein kinase [Acanthopleuribacter pedis]MBO1320822.1 serine/threonine protein kinase [Acanthopleuribacter pedis]
MDRTHWQRLNEHIALLDEMDPSRGDAYLKRLAENDPTMADELRAFIETDTDDVSQLAASARFHDDLSGQNIAGYAIVRRLGAGGMGTVYLAEAVDNPKRQVAVKVLSLAAPSPEIRERFDIEQRILGRLNHDHIAQLYEAGRLINGRPYFVMELVRGLPITQYCDLNQCSPEERFDLFRQTCAAVAHANDQGILHRDIKPSNVLVSRHNGVATVKVIDFGIAKDLNAVQDLTSHPHSPGTQRYMSPEQAGALGRDGRPALQDHRVDVYSLGVLLYELLLGEPPLSWSPGTAPLQIYSDICFRPAPLPRWIWKGLDEETREQRAAARGLTPRQWAAHLGEPITWVAMKALAKNPATRYASAREAAADVARYQNNQRLNAAAPSLREACGNLMRRHGLAATSLFLARS